MAIGTDYVPLYKLEGELNTGLKKTSPGEFQGLSALLFLPEQGQKSTFLKGQGQHKIESKAM